MLTADLIKRTAKSLGADVCGIGALNMFADEPRERNPLYIIPNGASILGFGFAVPRGLYTAMAENRQHYTYTTLGVKYIDEELIPIFLMKMSRLIENAGFDACLQRTVPNLRVKGDKTANPEAIDVYELVHSRPVGEGKPEPEVIIDFGKAAKTCGIGELGLSGHILSPKYGPFIRYCFILTDAPLAVDPPMQKPLCDKCGKCAAACPGNAINSDGLDTWQCAVYYKGAHKSNPFITDDFIKDNPERDDIINGKKRFNSLSGREIFKELDFLPKTQNGYSPCLCAKRCDIVCYNHLKETGII